ncbi:hypothetical protein L3X38_031143 [Prunus dulcis]|uniref:ADP-ribosyl cyclase/cyclic ADP-ribose hydrolase n=1 Tax=Prunus dulcis TaxID=3755 RepID=A0AAD4YUR7_PRUDU|nr:hypothetical protein L3X38_031143 [Prunus dulcis]
MALSRGHQDYASSSNSSPSRCRYHVFLSFRGEDSLCGRRRHSLCGQRLPTHQKPSSSNSSPCRCRYDVFLSFGGKDTRKTFTDHLYAAIVEKGFPTFRDKEEVERGEGIKPELQKAIQQSRSSVIVFSKDYASSGWFLDELVFILEHKRISSEHVVLPVFYDVDPSHLRNQTGRVGEAFSVKL